jgi:23S rRNA U2552 (ribose-2'-O)-methylase RlmE/FtsJ
MQVNLQTSSPFASEVKSLQQSIRSQNNPSTITETAQNQIASDIKENMSQKSNANSNISQLTGKGGVLNMIA